MNINEEFDAILETCIDDIAEGEASLEECLARYPQYADELEPVLWAATRLKGGRELQPSPFLRSRLRAELNLAMKLSPRQKSGLPLFFWRMALNVAVLMFALVMTNTVFAQGALPGESLYNWKLASERVWRVLSPDPLGTDLKLSERRVDEFLAVSRDENRRARVLVNYNELLTRIKAQQDDNDRQRIQVVLKSQQDSLRRVGLSIPELDNYFSGNSSSSGAGTQNIDTSVPVTQPNQ